MGDYSKLIVSCTVKGEIKAELEDKINDLRLAYSCYQSQEVIISILPNTCCGNKDNLNVILVGQTKRGDRQSDFCEWLRPYVVRGSGENDVYAMSFSEYSDLPEMWRIYDKI